MGAFQPGVQRCKYVLPQLDAGRYLRGARIAATGVEHEHPAAGVSAVLVKALLSEKC